MRSYYMCKYYFNASHGFGEDRGAAHSHTFTLVLYIGKRDRTDKADIKIVDEQMKRFLDRYEGSYLNELPEFEGENASIERMSDTFYEALKIQFRGTAFSLYQLDLSENPLSVYQVADRILLPTLNMENSKSNYDMVLKQKKQLEQIYKRG